MLYLNNMIHNWFEAFIIKAIKGNNSKYHVVDYKTNCLNV